VRYTYNIKSIRKRKHALKMARATVYLTDYSKDFFYVYKK
jgi:hypothetical protein